MKVMKLQTYPEQWYLCANVSVQKYLDAPTKVNGKSRIIKEILVNNLIVNKIQRG